MHISLTVGMRPECMNTSVRDPQELPTEQSPKQLCPGGYRATLSPARNFTKHFNTCVVSLYQSNAFLW